MRLKGQKAYDYLKDNVLTVDKNGETCEIEVGYSHGIGKTLKDAAEMSSNNTKKNVKRGVFGLPVENDLQASVSERMKKGERVSLLEFSLAWPKLPKNHGIRLRIKRKKNSLK